MASRFTELCIDCAEPRRLAQFWADVLDWRIDADESDDDEVALVDPEGKAPLLLFVKVPEPKTVKNRLHIDVRARNSTQEAEVERLLALGARHADVGQGEQTWVVLADPEGNEFCVLSKPTD